MGFKGNIKNYCGNNMDYADFLTRFDSAIIEIKSRLKIIPYYFRHFSRHEETHSELIIQYLEMLLGVKGIELLSISDQVMLVLAAYSHDIGMSLEHDQIENSFKKNSFAVELKNSIPKGYKDLDKIVEDLLAFPESVRNCNNSEVIKIYSDVSIVIENLFRKGHAGRSSEFIVSHPEIYSFLGIRGAKILARICSLHDANIENIMQLPYEENGFFGDYFHPRFLAGMLCLGDLLDLDTDRFDEVALKASCKMPILSLLHSKKHKSIERYLVKDGLISIWADCESIDVYQTLCEWTGWIKAACTFLIVNWDEITPDERILPPRMKDNKILIDGNDKWVGYADSKIHIDVEKAVKLFEGANLYKGKYIFIRELIQNAVDASLVQLYEDAIEIIHNENRDLLAEDILKLIKAKQLILKNYEISGRFYAIDNETADSDDCKNEKTVIFEIEDYGTGISKDEIDSIIGLRGKSDALKNKIKKMPVFFRPAGVFGIGLQSVFQVASKVVFITKTDDEKAKIITMIDPSSTGAVYIEDYEGRMHRGTKIMAYMDPDKFTEKDFGRAYYFYQTTPKYRMILTWLFQHAYNLDKERVPGFEARRQTKDYFDIKITGFLGDEDLERDVLIRESILSSMGENYDKSGTVNIKDGLLEYEYYDLENNCVFNACLLAGSDNDNISSKNAESKISENEDILLSAESSAREIRYGKSEDWFHYKYGHNIFYRNVLADSDFLHHSWEEGNKIGILVDFKINIFSDDADKILKVGRNSISADYHDTLMHLVEDEIVLMFERIIDYCIDNPSVSNRILFLAYVESNVYSYRTQELCKSKNIMIDKMFVNNYFNLEGEEIRIPLKKFFDSKILMMKEMTKEEADNLPGSIWCEKQIDGSLGDIYLCKYNVSRIKTAEEHIIVHKLTGDYFCEFDNKKYMVYEVIPYKHENKFGAAFRSEFIRYQEFLDVIFKEVRCILPSKGYEVLETPLSEGIVDSFRANNDNVIEIMLDTNFKNQLAMILMSQFYIQDAYVVIEELIKTERYQKNVDFIKNYHKRMGHNISDSVIEEKYKILTSELISLLQREDYREHLRKNISFYNLDVIGNRLVTREFDYFSIYDIRR